MITLDVKSELNLAAKWTNEHSNQLGYSIATAMNATVQGSKFISGSKQKSAIQALANQAPRYLDRPKKSTQKGWRATRASKRKLQTTILPKDKPYNQQRYLGGSATGGGRAPKDWEAAFVNHPRAINMPKGVQLVPTKAARKKPGVDKKHGNFTLKKIQRLYDSVGNSGRTGSNIFIGTPRTPPSRPPGVYRRERNNQLRALFIAVDRVRYGARFPVEKIVGQSMQKDFGIYLRKELTKNVAKKVKAGKADMRTGFF